jgi:UDP-N-acetylmuramate dehydrogenase
LISDRGFDGVVLQIGLKGIETIEQRSQMVSLTVGAGEDWDPFVSYCVEHDLAGVECLSGIPGLVGGTPVQNVGAYGQEVAGTIREVRCYDRPARQFVVLSNAECGFTYRSSIFNSTARDRYVVLQVTFELQNEGRPKIVYKDLVEYFDDMQPTLADVRSAVLKIRRAKSMVIDPADPNSKSAGSFFKNPVVERDKLDALRTRFPDMPGFEFGDKVKIPAAWLIEIAGFAKGYRLGNAGISMNHTLALINRGDATASEMIALKNLIQETVAAKFGIDLQPEPVFIGL